MLIKRLIQEHLQTLCSFYPVVTVTGPRQSGKTTLVRMTFPDYSYCNLEDPEIRALASNDHRAFFQEYSCPLIIDEVQRVPELMSRIQIIVDKTGKKGNFILTGSHMGHLHQAITQSLAGRTALLRLLPFSLAELSANNIHPGRDNSIFQGFMPRIFSDKIPPLHLYRNYFQTYIERDVRQLINIKNLILFENFMRMLAGRVGTILNLSSLANDLGVSGSTLREWLSVLEASFVIFRLPPFYENFGKRIIKSPKIYFTEPGLVAYLLGITAPEQVGRDPLCGNLFENLVVVEALKSRFNAGLEPDLYYFRDNNGNEVDLIFRAGRMLVPIEIKSSMTFNPDFLRGIKYFRKFAPMTGKGYVIYAGEITPDLEEAKVVNFTRIAGIFANPPS